MNVETWSDSSSRFWQEYFIGGSECFSCISVDVIMSDSLLGFKTDL